MANPLNYFPHSNATPAPQNKWGPDVLGAGFQARTLPLGADDEGELVATLVRYRPAEDPLALPGTPTNPHFAVLYLHGWNDYFFQTELARQCAGSGAGFFALDLRKYGRSWREGQSHGYIENLISYDEEIFAAISLIRHDLGPTIPLVLLGHSTGGLTATLFAQNHPEYVQALILNSPWLETTGSPWVRAIGGPFLGIAAGQSPKTVVHISSTDTYGPALAGWLESDGPLPMRLRPYPDDPSVVGWEVDTKWKARPSAPVRLGWLKAVTDGHTKIAHGLDLPQPIVVFASISSGALGSRWTPAMRRQDVVLDTDMIVRRAANLGRHITIFRHEALHDVFVSEPDVRAAVYTQLRTWIEAYLPATS